MSTCILLSSCDRYWPIAEFTLGQIERCWISHPEIFITGVSVVHNEFQVISLRDDPKDWMSITLHACHEVLAKGYTKCYLILDDHPPLEKCHDTHLNSTLPQMMDRLNASVISLYGWGQSGGTREPCGTILSNANFNIERLKSDYLWKFSLHPGLWDVSVLIAILDELLRTAANIKERNPWRFERVAGAPDFAISEKIKTNSYRICGSRMTAAPFRSKIRCGELFICDSLHYLTNIFLGKYSWLKLYTFLGHIYHYYEGPYPVYWRGLVTKGEINEELKRFLVLHNRGVALKKMVKCLSYDYSKNII